MSFYNRYKECCKFINISPTGQEAADKLGCSRANISLIAKNDITPKGDIVAGAARMLGVSSDYLLGLTNIPAPLTESEESSKKLQEAVMLFNQLNDDGQNAALAVLKGLVAEEMYRS